MPLFSFRLSKAEGKDCLVITQCPLHLISQNVIKQFHVYLVLQFVNIMSTKISSFESTTSKSNIKLFPMSN